MHKHVPLNNFLGILTLFFQLDFPEKGRVLSKLVRTCDATERANNILVFSFFFPWKFRLKQQIQGFQTFFGGYLFVIVERRCNRRSKLRTKYFKNRISIFGIVNYQNWLDALFPLTNSCFAKT